VPPGLITLDAVHSTVEVQAVPLRDTSGAAGWGIGCGCAWMRVRASITAVRSAGAIQYSMPEAIFEFEECRKLNDTCRKWQLYQMVHKH